MFVNMVPFERSTLSLFRQALFLLISLCCFSFAAQAQSTQFSAGKTEAGTWVAVIEVTSELTVTSLTSEVCHQTLASERDKAIEDESKKSMITRWLTPSNPAAKPLKRGEFLENQHFLIETVCAPTQEAIYQRGPYFASYLWKGEIRQAAFKFHPENKIQVLKDGSVVGALVGYMP
jgi:hypothetical protein